MILGTFFMKIDAGFDSMFGSKMPPSCNGIHFEAKRLLQLNGRFLYLLTFIQIVIYLKEVYFTSKSNSVYE